MRSKVLAVYKSSSGRGEHAVTLGDDGVIYCTCPGWRLHAKRRCKHLDMYERTIAGSNAQTVVKQYTNLVEELITEVGKQAGLKVPKRTTVESVTDAMIAKLKGEGYGH